MAEGGRGTLVLSLWVLSEVPLREAAEGKVPVEAGPREAEGSAFDGVASGGGAVGETRIFRDGEAEFEAARHADADLAAEREGAPGGVSRGVQAKECHS